MRKGKVPAKSYKAGTITQLELEQLCLSSEGVGDMAGRALRAANQLGVIFANTELLVELKRDAEVAAELYQAQKQAMADELAGLDSYRFPA